MFCRVMFSPNPWDGAVGAYRSSSLTAIIRAKDIWEGQSMAYLFCRQDLSLTY